MVTTESTRARVTSADVAALAGVSQSTVSYVMTGKRSISNATRARVLAAMKTLGFQPNAGARALAGRRSNVIGLVVRLDTTTDMAGTLPFIDTVTKAARESDYDVVLVSGEDGTAEMERLAGRSVVDAVILMDIRETDHRLATARELKLPVVLIGSPDDPHGLDAFDFDFESAAQLAVDELAHDGTQRLVLIGEPPAVESAGFAFVRGFEDAVIAAARAAGMTPDIVRPESSGVSHFHSVADRILPTPGERTGVVARTPHMVGLALHYLSEHGVKAGIDIALVGLCTDEAAVTFPNAVTNVSPEPRAVSLAAVHRVIQLIDGSDLARGSQTLLAPRLTRRETTRGPRPNVKSG